MAKRLSKARRAKALNRTLVVQRAKMHDDSYLLQQGRVSSPLTRHAANLKGIIMPRGIDLESSGRKARGGVARFTGRSSGVDFNQSPKLDAGVADAKSPRAPKSDD